MSHLSKLFDSIPIDLPKRSGFDMSFENIFSGTTGTLVPICVEELLPNDTVSLGYFCNIELPPMATNFFGRIDYNIEAFFVPYRLLWGGWRYFWTAPDYNPFSPSIIRPTGVIRGTVAPSAASGFFKRGTLPDYLGIKGFVSSPNVTYRIPNLMPFLAYASIYDHYYRNKTITKPLFVNPDIVSGSTIYSLSSIPWRTGVTSTQTVPVFDLASTFNDGSHFNILRQRQWAKDYFTTASLYPQYSSNPSSVSFDTSGTSGSFTIAQLRNANNLQKFSERNNLAGFDYPNQIYAQYGVMPPDSLIDKPIFLGHSSFGVYNKSVYQTSDTKNVASSGKNPFNGVQGNKASSCNGFNKDSLIDSFHTKEHGYLFVLGSLTPHAYYSTGTRRYLLRSSQGDFAIPLLQGLGEQAIYDIELSGGLPDNSSSALPLTTFGYQQQYSEYKYHDDEVHGILSHGENLESFTLQRWAQGEGQSGSGSFNNVLNTDFLEIPVDFLDQVMSVSTASQGFSYWADFFFVLKKVSTLSEYVVPTLGDLKNTYKGRVDYRGTDIR